MPSYLLVAGHTDGLTASGYNAACGTIYPHAVEVQAQLIARDSYTLSNLYVRVIANTLGAIVRSRINAANGNQVISIGAGATGAFTDPINTDSLASGDLFDTLLGASDIVTWTIVSYVLSTVSNTTPILAAVNDYQKYSGTAYCVVNGFLATTVESYVQYKFRVSAVLSNLRVYIRGNTTTSASTVRTRINAGDGNQSVSIPAGATGAFEDTTNTDSVSAGDNVNYQVVAGADAFKSLFLNVIQVKSNSAGRQVCAGSGNSYTLSYGLTRYVNIEGDPQSFSATESDSQATARTSFTARNMYVNISVNSVNNSTTFRIRKNTANGNMVVSVGAAATGQFEDTTDTDDFVAADLLNWSVVTGGTSGTIVINVIGFELPQAGVPVAAVPVRECLSRGAELKRKMKFLSSLKQG